MNSQQLVGVLGPFSNNYFILIYQISDLLTPKDSNMTELLGKSRCKTALNYIRRFLPNLGSIDISPVILILALMFLRNFIFEMFAPSLF